MNNMTDDNFDNTNNFDEFDNFDMQNAGQDFEEFQEEHKPKNKTKAVATIIFVCALAGIGFAGYQYYFKPMLSAQNHADLDDGMPSNPYAQDSGLPPTVTSDTTAPSALDNPVADTLAPPAPPVVDNSGATPPAPPLVADDGTVPPDMAGELPQSEDSVSNQALPAPTASAPSDAAPAVEAPARVSSPSEAIVADDEDDIIKPTLPIATTDQAASAEIAKTDTASATIAPVAETTTLPPAVTDEKPAPAAALPAPVEAAAQPVAPQVPVAASTAPIDTESAAKLQALEQKVTQLPSADTIAALTRQIEVLTQRLEALDKRTETLATNLQNREVTPNAVAPVVSPVASSTETAPAPVVKTAPKKPVSKPKAKPAPRPSASGWVLRSAQPGAAWLSKPGSEEMVRYTVGQTLPGAGTITAVTQENGAWVLKTNNGLTIRP
jgi:hypothetical protein